MKKLSKSIYILILIIIFILIYLVGMHNYRKPITLHKTFDQAIIVKKSSGEVIKKSTIEINAKIFRGIYSGSILKFNAHFMNILDGTIVIDNKTYSFEGATDKSSLNNIIGNVYKNSESNSDGFMFKMVNLDSIVLIGDEKTLYNVTAPSQSIKDYKYLIDESISK